MRRIVLLVFASTWCAIPSWAQERPAPPQRPFRGLFGVEPARPGSRRTMTIQLSASEIYDSAPVAANPFGWSQRPNPALNGQVQFARSGRRFGVGFGGSALAQQASSIGNRTVADGSAQALFKAQLSRHVNLQATQTLGSSPRYAFAVQQIPAVDSFGGDVAVPIADGELTELRTLNLQSQTTLTYAIGRRTSLLVDYGHLQFMTSGGAVDDLTSDRAAGHLSYRVSKNLSARFGYGQQLSRYRGSGASDVRVHQIDSGVDYGRGIAVARRTRIAFTTGSAIVSTSEQMQATVTGTADLQHQFVGTWSAGLSYIRGVSYDARVAQPVVLDSIAARTSGFVGRRFNATLSAEYARGRIGLGVAASPFETVGGTTALYFALGRRVALFAHGSLHDYGFRATVPEWLGGQRQWNIQTGVTWRMPVLR
jgi:hypothetical protein